MRAGENVNVGLALSAGGARGLAHIGVINVLEREHIPIDFIAGTSIGALIGGLYAHLRDAEKLKSVFLREGLKHLVSLIDPTLLTGYLIRGDKIEDFLRDLVGRQDISRLAIPFAAVTCDIRNGREIVLDRGDLAEAMRASISIPVVFKPVKKQEMLLVDGGLVNPLPCDVVKRMGARVVMAVHFSIDDILDNDAFAEERRYVSPLKMGLRSLDIMESRLTAA